MLSKTSGGLKVVVFLFSFIHSLRPFISKEGKRRNCRKRALDHHLWPRWEMGNGYRSKKVPKKEPFWAPFVHSLNRRRWFWKWLFNRRNPREKYFWLQKKLCRFSPSLLSFNTLNPRYNESLRRGQRFVKNGISFHREGLVMKWNFLWPQNSL